MEMEERPRTICDNNIVSRARVSFQSVLQPTFNPQSISLTRYKAAPTALSQSRINWILLKKGGWGGELTS